MILSLSGFMGSGKSSVGKVLKQKLPSFILIDLDDYIIEQTGRKITDIFAEEGEKGFREKEALYLEKLLTSINGNLIISLGGGTLTTPNCRKLISEKSTNIYLRATEDSLVSILSENNSNRPMLRGGSIRDKVRELMQSRSSIYESSADFIIDIDNRSYEDIADEIIKSVNKI